MVFHDDDFDPVIGGIDLSNDDVRDDLNALRDLCVDSDIDRHIVRLLHLHPKLGLKFRNQDLSSLDDATKKALIEDMNVVLGIQPLKPTSANDIR